MEPAAAFNEAFFESAPNCLAELVPDAASFVEWVRLIDVPAATGCTAEVVANPQTQSAVCYLACPR